MKRRNPGMTARAQDAYVDRWTPVHFLIGAALGVVFPEFWVLLVLVMWEPFVLLVLSPRLKGPKLLMQSTQLSGPTLRNVLVDLVADVAGVIVGAYLLRPALGVTPLF